MNEISDCLGIARHAVGNGSTEPREFLHEVANAIGLAFEDYRTKQHLAEGIARTLGESWDNTCDSRKYPLAGGGTVTLAGLQRISRGLHWLMGNRDAAFEMKVAAASKATTEAAEPFLGN